MPNYLKWGLVAAAIAGIVIFRDQIKGGLSSAGRALGEGVGGAAGSFITGTVGGLVQPFLPPQGLTPQQQYEWGRRNLPQGFPSPLDLFRPNPPAEASMGGDPISDKDNATDPAITPYNREQVAKLEMSAARNVTRGGFSQQSKETALTYIKYNVPINVAESSAKQFMTAFNNMPAGGHADRVRAAQQQSGTSPTPLALFRLYKAQGMSNAEAMRLVRQRIA